METWSSSACRGMGLEFDESISAASSDVIAMDKNGMVCRELKYSFECDFENNLLHMNSTQEPIESPGFVGFGTLDIIREPSSSSDSVRDVLCHKFDGGTMLNSVVAATKAVPQDHKSSSKLSVSVAESSCCCKESSFVDLNLGRFADTKDVQNYNFSKALTYFSTTMPVKRVRTGNLSTNTSFCQVYGCSKDLSSSKDYHKRHKVCEVHSKTAEVIVNGIEQRFCQQCSRFHLLAEFDDGKRSCRKRLAGHNERRRKPRGSSFHGNAFTSPFIYQETVWSSPLHLQKYGTNDYYRNLKLKEVSDYLQESAISSANGHLYPRSPFNTHGFEKQYPVQENMMCTPWGRKFSENGYLFPHLEGSNFSSHFFYPNPLIGCGTFTCLDSASTAKGLSESDCALSLLSSQSENSSTSSVIHSLLIPGSNVPYNVTETSQRVLGVSSHASASGISSKFYSSQMNSDNASHLDTVFVSGDSVNFGPNENFRGSECMSDKDPLPCTDMPTINLLQLSSKLRQVESQRISVLLKQENDAFCGL